LHLQLSYRFAPLSPVFPFFFFKYVLNLSTYFNFD